MHLEDSAVLDQLRTVSVWKRGAQRAPHKPLLLLMTLASVQRGEERLQKYADISPRLAQLLVDFGPPRRSVHPEFPFWRLQNDGFFWEVAERELAIRARGDRARTGDVPTRVLLDINARGGFAPEVYAALRANPGLINRIAAGILEEHFAPSLHESLLEAVGMPWVFEAAFAVKRSREFRADVIRLYEHRCAMCGFDGRLGISDVALEAAHIMWNAMGGPDDPQNSLLLCSIHHKALDRGAMGLSEDRRILVSQHLHGGAQVRELIINLSGEAVRPPLDPAAAPAAEFVRWHRTQVFREPARPAA